jgi:hypothetical protein
MVEHLEGLDHAGKQRAVLLRPFDQCGNGTRTGAGHLEPGVRRKQPAECVEIAALTRGIGVTKSSLDVLAAAHGLLP